MWEKKWKKCIKPTNYYYIKLKLTHGINYRNLKKNKKSRKTYCLNSWKQSVWNTFTPRLNLKLYRKKKTISQLIKKKNYPNCFIYHKNHLKCSNWYTTIFKQLFYTLKLKKTLNIESPPPLDYFKRNKWDFDLPCPI